jgi:group I intron endonuclease
MIMYIYKITNIKNKKFYIGKSKNVEKRWKQHLSLVGKKRHPLYDAIKSYGIENFKLEIIDCNEETMIDELEKKWILETNAIKLGYNMTDGGTGGDTFSNKSEELKKITRDKLRQIMKDNNPMFNPIIKQKLKEIQSGDDYKNKMSEIANSRREDFKVKVSNGLKLALKSSELRKKWSECKIGDKNGRSLGTIIVTDLNGNETKYETAKDAAKKLVVTAHLIREHCRNKTTFQRGIYKGWKFRFDDKKY